MDLIGAWLFGGAFVNKVSMVKCAKCPSVLGKTDHSENKSVFANLICKTF